MANHTSGAIRWYVDESLLFIGLVLRLVRKDVTYPGHYKCSIELETDDVDWLPVVGKQGWNVLTRDRRVWYRPKEKSELVDGKVKAFCLKKSGNSSKWAILCLLIKHWDDIEEAASHEGPFMYYLTSDGLRKAA